MRARALACLTCSHLARCTNARPLTIACARACTFGRRTAADATATDGSRLMVRDAPACPPPAAARRRPPPAAAHAHPRADVCLDETHHDGQPMVTN